MRDKLIELCDELLYDLPKAELFADHLISHGVTFAEENKILTNADRIRAMSDEELIQALLTLFYCDDIYLCDNCIWDASPFCTACIASENEKYDWLKQPAKEVT